MNQPENEADRLRAAIGRRGPVEARLGHNAGQARIVAERDRAIERWIGTASVGRGRLLDIGCGEGTMLAHLMDAGVIADGDGVDLLPERIERARAARPDLRFQVADAAVLPFPDRSFDVVLAMTVFSSVPLPARAPVAVEIARVIRPGGVFIWYDLRVRSPTNPDVRPFRSADVEALFPGWQVAARRITVAPPLARRLGRMAPAVYPLLARVAVLLTHEAGLARKPAIDDS